MVQQNASNEEIKSAIMKTLPGELKAVSLMPASFQRQYLSVKLDQLVEMGSITTAESNRIQGLVDGDEATIKSTPADNSTVARQLEDLMNSDPTMGVQAAAGKLTTILSAVGGGVVGRLLGGPAGEIYGIAVGAAAPELGW